MQEFGLWPWLIGRMEILPYAKKFRVSARFHDIAYKKWGTEQDKIRADNMFYRLMVSVSNTHLQLFFAWLYYKLVKRFWFIFFNYHCSYEI